MITNGPNWEHALQHIKMREAKAVVTDQYSSGLREIYWCSSYEEAEELYETGARMIEEMTGCVVGIIGVRILWFRDGQYGQASTGRFLQ